MTTGEAPQAPTGVTASRGCPERPSRGEPEMYRIQGICWTWPAVFVCIVPQEGPLSHHQNEGGQCHGSLLIRAWVEKRASQAMVNGE